MPTCQRQAFQEYIYYAQIDLFCTCQNNQDSLEYTLLGKHSDEGQVIISNAPTLTKQWQKKTCREIWQHHSLLVAPYIIHHLQDLNWIKLSLRILDAVLSLISPLTPSTTLAPFLHLLCRTPGAFLSTRLLGSIIRMLHSHLGKGIILEHILPSTGHADTLGIRWDAGQKKVRLLRNHSGH